MALPLPRVVADTSPGGGLVTAMGGINSLNNDMLMRKINEVKAKYAPLTAQAEAASKMAYANLMGPQFLAKLMGNDSALANMSEDQKSSALSKLYQAGSRQGTGNALMNMPIGQQPNYSGVGQPSTNSFSDKIKNALHGFFVQGSSQQEQGQNPFAMGGQQPQQQGFAPQQQSEPQADDGIDHGYDMAMDAFLKSPEGQAEMAKGDQGRMPTRDEALDWYHQQQGDPGMSKSPSAYDTFPGRRKTYAEKTGEFKGIVGEGQETGKIRAKDIDALNTSVFNAETQQATLNDIGDILASPEFEEIRQVPLAGQHELSYYGKEGTPAQQQMVGRYFTLTGNLIKDASRDFAGQFRKGEQKLLSGMKPGASDTVDSAKGKTEALTVLNKMLSERSRITSKIMTDYHVNKLDALEAADKQVNGEKIRQSVHDRLNPMVTLTNPKTGETMTLSVTEARKRGFKNE